MCFFTKKIKKKNKKEQDFPIDPRYKWLWDEPAPKILLEARRWYGVLELEGDANNPVIIEWAKEIGGWIGEWYDKDSIPWCGLFMAICAKRAGYKVSQKSLSALEWANWGDKAETPMLGDVMVFKRTGGGHVGVYVGEDKTCYHILGGNQSDMVCITRIRKDRFYASRRCPWKVGQPKNIRVIKLDPYGTISSNEK